MEEYKGLVYKIARRLYNAKIYVRCLGDIDDIIQIGMVGLLKAKEKWVESKGYPFLKYAAYKIQFEILDAARNGGFIRIPRNAQKTIKEKKGLRFISVKKCEDLDLQIIDTNTINQTNKVDKDDILKFVGCLTDKEQYIINRYFGLDGEKSFTFKMIGDRIGLSPCRVLQIVRNILKEGKNNKYIRGYNCA